MASCSRIMINMLDIGNDMMYLHHRSDSSRGSDGSCQVVFIAQEGKVCGECPKTF
jgi:hypothetical protein